MVLSKRSINKMKIVRCACCADMQLHCGRNVLPGRPNLPGVVAPGTVPVCRKYGLEGWRTSVVQKNPILVHLNFCNPFLKTLIGCHFYYYDPNKSGSKDVPTFCGKQKRINSATANRFNFVLYTIFHGPTG